MSYIPLRVRSAYSLGRGTATPQALAAQAARYGHEALALTDRNNLYGVVPFVTACRDAGVRPIVGAEVDGPDGLLTLLVGDAGGYGHLCRLLTRRMLDPGFRLLPALQELHPGLHVLCADPGLLPRLQRFVPRDALWAELAAPRHGHPDFGALRDAAGRLGVPVVATGDVTTLERRDHDLHATLTAIRETTLVSRLGRGDVAPPEAYFKAPASMASIFRAHPQALRNTRTLADRCRHAPSRERWIFPDPPLPGGSTAAGHLRGLCEAGVVRRYGRMTGRVQRRLDRELAVIDELGFSPYFVVVGEIVRFARDRGIATVGRGSGASAVVAYVLGITSVDPIRYRLRFERFLHRKRPDFPDLDIDLCWKRRDEVIEHVYETYGRDRVAMISTHNTFRMRSAFRETARAHGVSSATVNRLSKCVPHAGDVPLRAALERSPRGREIPRREPPWPRVLEQAERLVGLPRHLGLHPGGIVIGDGPLAHHVPLEEATKGILCTQFEMRAIEAVGLVKIDLLGNRALSTIQQTVELVQARHGTRLDPDTFPHEDSQTAVLLGSGDTLGVFQMESPGMRNLNRMLQTRDLATTIAAVALIRPGPAGSGMKERFVRRQRGLEPVTYLDPRLAPLLRDTHGIPLYEEDVMMIAAEVMGLSREDGDVLRRTLAGGTPDDRARGERLFLARAAERGYGPGVAAAIWDQLAQFGAFAFCKAHAAGYGVLSWQSGWLKAHYPVEFAVAILNHHAGMYDKRTHLEDAKRRGVRVRRPDVNRSQDLCVAEDDAVRIGLEWVRGLTATTRSAILRERERRPYAGLEDLLARVRPARPEVEALVLAGGFDFTGRTRPELLCLTATAFDALRGRAARPDDLFATEAPVASPWVIPRLPEFSAVERLWLEWFVIGLCAEGHPMAELRATGLPPGLDTAREAEARSNHRVRVAGIVAARRTVPTRGGRSMQFVTLEDETGLIECTLFPDAYRRHRGQVRGLGPYLAEGRIEEQYGAPTLTVERIQPVPITGALRAALRSPALTIGFDVAQPRA